MAQNISMTQIPPQGELKIYRDIEIGSGRQKIFRTKAEQQAYFNDHLVMSFSDMSYIRMGRGIQIESDTVSIANCDYISFKNKAVTGFEDEIYASIDPNWEYVNPNTVKINYTIDWWQTCMHSGIVFKEGVVRREHMNETDWTAAVANPYADIFQLQTSEELPMDESMERIATLDSGDISVFPEIPSTGVSDDDMRLMLILGQTDFSEVQPPPNMNIPSGINPMIWIIGQIGSDGGSVEKGTTIQGIPNACTIFIMKYQAPISGGTSPTITTFNNLLNILEFNGITGNIVGLYWIPKEYALMTQQFVRHSMSPVPSNYAPRNPKLYRAPYCYLRVSDETGQYKHYQWEEFQPLVLGSLNIAQLDIFFSKTGMPVMFVAPKQYKTIIGASNTSVEALLTNMDEALVHDDIPYLPYSTDGYVSALGSKFRESWSGVNPIKNSIINSMLGGKTTPNLMSYMGAGATSVLAHPMQTLTDIMNFGQGGKEVWRDRIDALAKADMEKQNQLFKMNSPKNWLAGIGNNLAKATVADNYNVGSSKGWAGYMRAPLRFIFQKVCPRADIVEQYDKYFDYFGYNSGRIGVPYVYNYIKRTGDQPHFATIDGEQVTYCQADITVMADGKAPEVAARAIEAMFSSGILFTK